MPAPLALFSHQLPIADEHNSNDSFDLRALDQFAPSAADLFRKRRAAASNSAALATFWGPLSAFDLQVDFDYFIPDWNDMYMLNPGPSGTLSVMNHTIIATRLENVVNIIKFRVFAHEFKRAYVGTLEDLVHATKEAVTQVEKNLRNIRMTYKCPRSGNTLEAQPDTIYERMIVFVTLLPEDVSIWHFTLPTLYWEALSSELQAKLIRHDIRPADPSTLLTKQDHIDQLTILRDRARLEYVKLQEKESFFHRMQSRANKGSHRQHVQTHTLSTTRSYSTPRYHYDPVILEHNTTSVELPTPTKRKDDSNHYNTSSSYYNSQSRAEQTMHNAHRAQSHSGLFPQKFVRTFHTSNGKQYPDHPDGSQRYSRFPVSFDGCFGCGGRHPFRECGSRTDPITKKNFHFDIQCHNPEVYFKYIESHQSNQHLTQRPRLDSVVPSNIASTPTTGNGRGKDMNRPAWQSQNRYSDYKPASGSTNHNVRQFVL